MKLFKKEQLGCTELVKFPSIHLGDDEQQSVRLRAQLDRPVRDYNIRREEDYLPGQTSKRLESQDIQSTLLILHLRNDITE